MSDLEYYSNLGRYLPENNYTYNSFCSFILLIIIKSLVIIG